MATKKLYDLAVKTGTYNAGGQEKGRYENVGAVMQSDDGGKFLMLKRTFNIAGVPDLTGRNSDSVLVSMFPPKDSDAAPEPAPAAPQRQQYDDTIPF